MSQISRRTLLQAVAATTGGVLLSGGLDNMVAQAGGHGRPDKLTLGPGRRPTRWPGPAEPAAEVPVPLVPRHRRPAGRARRRHRPARPARRDGRVSWRHGGTSGWSATTRSTDPSANAFGAGVPYDAFSGGGTTTSEVTPDGQVRAGVHQLERHADELFRRCHAVGFVDHLRGDGERTRRRAGLHRRVERDAPTAARLPLRSAGRRAVRPAADHRGRPLRTRGSRLQPARRSRLSHRGQLLVPVRPVPLPPTREHPMRARKLLDGGRLQMLRVVGVPNAHLEAEQAIGASYDVDWVDIEDPSPTFPYTPGQPAPTANNDALVHVGEQGRAQGAAGFSRLEGASYTKGEIYFTSTQGGGAAGDRARTHGRVRKRNRAGLVVRPAPIATDLPIPVARRRRRSSCPTTSRRATITAASSSAKTARPRTTSAGSTGTGACSTSPSTS